VNPIQCIATLTLIALVQACSSGEGVLAPDAAKGRQALEVHFSDWSTPVNLGPVINSPSIEQHPAISKDGLSLYFVSDRPGSLGNTDIWVSQRTTALDPWGPPQNLGPNVNSSENENAPAFSPDGHWLYFGSRRAGGCGAGTSDLWMSHRHDKHDDFGWEAPINLGCTVNSPAEDDGPTIFEDDATGITTLYFTSLRPGIGDFDIYASTRVGDDGPFDAPILVQELDTPFRDTRTAIRRDGLELFLTSSRPTGAIGSFDLWVSTRATTLDSWSTPVNLGPTVNSAAIDGAPALSFDATTLYFYSTRPGGFGGNDLYVTTRTRAPEP
jgi:hypothetical protein